MVNIIINLNLIPSHLPRAEPENTYTSYVKLGYATFLSKQSRIDKVFLQMKSQCKVFFIILLYYLHYFVLLSTIIIQMYLFLNLKHSKLIHKPHTVSFEILY